MEVLIAEPEIMVGHQTFSDHFWQMSNQLLLCSDKMSDHLKTLDHRYSTLKVTNSCPGSTYEHRIMFTVALVDFIFHYLLDNFDIFKVNLNQICIMSDHISKHLNSLVFDQTFCQYSHEM